MFEATAELQPFHLKHDPIWESVIDIYDPFDRRAKPHSAAEPITVLRQLFEKEDWPSQESIDTAGPASVGGF